MNPILHSKKKIFKIHVGGHTEIEMKEKKDRVEDALHATKAALEQGILPGGGIALLNASMSLVSNEVQGDAATGYSIVANACSKPFAKILENAGYEKTAINEIEEEIVSKEGDLWAGYNPRTREVVNMFDEGIIDPTKVTRLALENAASVAGTLLITEAVVSKGKESKKEQPGGMDPSMLLG